MSKKNPIINYKRNRSRFPFYSTVHCITAHLNISLKYQQECLLADRTRQQNIFLIILINLSPWEMVTATVIITKLVLLNNVRLLTDYNARPPCWVWIVVPFWMRIPPRRHGLGCLECCLGYRMLKEKSGISERIE